MVFPRLMMATKANHKMGDLSAKTPSPCIIQRKDEEKGVYVGFWALGLGFVNVEFPVGTTRDLNESEAEKYRGAAVGTSQFRIELGPLINPG
jgi:hypothetical protein